MKWKKKDFLTLQELPVEELETFIDYALTAKSQILPGIDKKSVVNLLLTPSLHTRLLMETAIQHLSGKSIVVDFLQNRWKLLVEEGAMIFSDETEHVRDVAQVLSRYGNCLAVQHVADSGNWRIDRQDSIIKALAKYCTIPVVNLESALFNPCQALADIVTIREHLKSLEGWKAVLAWTYHPGTHHMSTANSFALVASKCGMDLTIACPPGYELDHGILGLVRKNAQNRKSSFETCNELEKAMSGAHIVYAVNWRSIQHYGNYAKEKELRKGLSEWQITPQLMDKTDGGCLMHPLPIKRNVAVVAELLDGETSLAYNQAENRLHVCKTLLSLLLNN